MKQQEIQEKVNAFLIDRLEYEPNAIKPEAELKRDLGMTSLDAVAPSASNPNVVLLKLWSQSKTSTTI